jgi:hypothetical protein
MDFIKGIVVVKQSFRIYIFHMEVLSTVLVLCARTIYYVQSMPTYQSSLSIYRMGYCTAYTAKNLQTYK